MEYGLGKPPMKGYEKIAPLLRACIGSAMGFYPEKEEVIVTEDTEERAKYPLTDSPRE